MAKKDTYFVKILILFAGIILLNVLSSYFYKRFDLTQDKRYTLSEAAKQTIADIESPIIVDVFLEGNFPSEFRRLQAETKQLLEEFSAYNPKIKFQFLNGSDIILKAEEDFDDAERTYNQRKILFERKEISEAEWKTTVNNYNRAGRYITTLKEFLEPVPVTVRENGKVSTELVYPWALAYFGDKTVVVPLLKNQLGTTSEERITNSIQNLEYAFADGFSKLTHPKRRKVAVLKGNGELDDRYVADFFGTLRDYYYIAPFTLDSAAVAPKRTLEQLNEFDLIVVAGPSEAFTDSEKYILDQFTMNGGASLWLIDATENRIDTLSGNTFAIRRELNMNDFFFKYGIRINRNLVKDIYAAPIVLANGQERDAQYNPYPWFYSPLSSSANNHPIVSNIEAVKFDYASAIDTLPNGIKKTVLLSTSPITKIIGLPVEINIDKEIPLNLKVVNEGPDMAEFNAGETPLAVLLEGEFTSVFTNRVKPFNLSEDKTRSTITRMVVISDADIIKNQLDRGRALELGFDKWTQSYYGNKEFLLNTVNYLLDDSGLINIRTKEIAVLFLDPQRTSTERIKWQLVNLLLPLGLLAIFGFLFQYLRKRKYAR